MDRAIIHIDMDAFYASIEQRDNPSYKGKPIAVGGSPQGRGVVCTASYEARKYGVKSAMSSKRAKQLCPNIIFVPVRMQKYIEVSNRIYEILEEYADLIEPISIDEAFLDVTGKNAIEIGMELKNKIKNDTGLTASVGISINKYLAKLASDYRKPNGFTIIRKNDVEKFLSPLPIRKLWGVGLKTEKELNRLGLYYVRDVWEYDKDTLIEKFGKKGLELFRYAKGKDDRPVENRHRRKSIGEENTFDRDIDDIDTIKSCIFNHCKMLAYRLQKRKLFIKTVTLKVKYEDFSSITRSITLPNYVNDFDEIYPAAEKILLKKIHFDKRIRLLGVQASNILYPDEPIQIQMKDIF